MHKYLGLAFKNTWRNKRRSFLTISSMAVSLCLLGILVAMYHTLFYGEATPGQALRVVVRHKVSLGNPLPQSYEGKIQRVAGVRVISPWNWFGGTYKDNRETKNRFARFAVDPTAFLQIRTQMTMPDDQRQAFIHNRTSCIVSSDLAASQGFKVGQKITLIGDIYPVTMDLTIAGIFDDPDAQNSLYFNVDYLRQLVGIQNRSFDSMIAILADSPQSVPEISKTVDAMFGDSPFPTKTESEQEFARSFVSFLGNVKLFLIVICAAVTFTILLVSGNTMAMSVRERIQEVGVLKTLGFTNDAILGMVLGEALAIALIGGAIGVFLAGILAALISHAHVPFINLHSMGMAPSTILICLGIALFVGFISSVIPAINAARTNILDSLRYAG